MTPDLKALVERLRRNGYYVRGFDEAADAIERLMAERDGWVEVAGTEFHSEYELRVKLTKAEARADRYEKALRDITNYKIPADVIVTRAAAIGTLKQIARQALQEEGE